MSTDALDFEIDKTHNTLFEAGKNKSSAFSKYILLLATTSLLVFGQISGENFKVPFVDLTLNKNLAAFMLLLLSCAALYWYNMSYLKEKLLRYKLRELFKKRHCQDLESTWNVSYPSPLWIPTSSSFRLPSPIAIVSSSIFDLISVISYSLPVVLSWKITAAYDFNLIIRIMISVFIIAPAVIVQIYVFFSPDMRDENMDGFIEEKLIRPITNLIKKLFGSVL